MKITSVRTRLLVLLLPFFILFFAILSGVSYYFSTAALTKNVNKAAIAINSDYSHQIRGIINERVIELEALANNGIIRSNSDVPQIVKLLAETHKQTGAFDNINCLKPSGTGVRFDGSTTNVSDREYVKEVVSTKKIYISNPGLTRGTNKLGIIIAVPVLDNGQLTGIITGNVSLDRVTSLINDSKFMESGFASIIHNSGIVLANPKQPELNGKLNISQKKIDAELNTKLTEVDENFSKLFEQAKGGKQVIGQYKNFDGVKHVGVLAPIELPGGQQWIAVVSAPETEVTAETGKLAKTMIIISLLFIIIAVVFIAYISKSFAKPIQLIRDECILLANGDLRDQAAEIHSDDEIGQLAKGFCDMRVNLRNLVRQVQAQSENVSASSEELTAGAQQSAEASSQVACSITQIANGTAATASSAAKIAVIAERMSDSTEQVSFAAHQVSEIAQSASRQAEEGRKSVEHAVAQMQQIGQGSQAVETAINDLAKGSQEITEIVNLI
ncbi:methyl-accepting chemotaxis protein [Sporomusaceae bacterium BoRhaA]|uniref:methyl-accepting chemotaxis protein n=1 Tax=Pelorhabdus rhamnosifermentans TaxID=2772457 RepID=UPI001FE29742|nr:methyl-accepting chemotaxis protein [Pelorhabdus rhamnosifermentans]MBU2699575.1 methyl-accepting chemotaxis protein [Pelorhabdus rhamnosifermentans]